METRVIVAASLPGPQLTSCRHQLHGHKLIVRTPCRPPSLQQRQMRTQSLFGGKGDGKGGGNPFANMTKMMEDVKKAQQLVQFEAGKVQAELAASEFDGYSNDETVRVVMSGNQEPRSVDITEAAMEGGAERLSELVVEAMKDAHAKSVDGMKQKMQALASRVGLPGGSDNPMLK